MVFKILDSNFFIFFILNIIFVQYSKFPTADDIKRHKF